MHALLSIRRRTRGQSMVEFALIVPLLFLFILGIIEMGYALFVYTSVQNAAREGARSAAVRPCPTSADTTAIQDATRSRLPALVNTSLVNPSITYSVPAKPDFGTAVTVTVNYSFQLLDPLVQRYIPQVNVNAVASRSITTGCSSAVVTLPTLTPTDTVTPGPSPTNTSTPTSMCTVPNFINMKVNNAQSAWSGAGFTGSLTKNGGPGNWDIAAQSIASGSSVTCSSSITVSEANVPTPTPVTLTATATATNTPSVTPVMPTATATNTPSVTPTPSAIPTATPCTRVVPSLINMTTNGNPSQAESAWAAAGFTGSVNRGDSGNYTIGSQSLASGSVQPCSASITVYKN